MNKQMKSFLMFFGAALAGGLISVAIYQMFDSTPDNVSVGQNEARMASYEIRNVNVPNFDFTEVAEITTPTVVHIRTSAARQRGSGERERRHPFEDFFGERFDDFFEDRDRDGFMPPREGAGSGVIISQNGYIVTNKHVIHNASEITVTLNDNRQFEADIIGTDQHTDIAVIKIDADDLQGLSFGDSDELKVGEWVVAVGNPFNLKSTVTAGIVSAKARNLRLLGGGASIESFIQTDAAVNPGNSGGALVNTRGELVGINTAIATRTGQYAGYSFAVPVNIVRKVVEDIVEYGEVKRGFVGVNISPVTPEIAEDKGLEQIAGAYVEGLMDGGAAEEAGVEEGDVIIGLNDREVTSVPHLQEYVGLHRPGDEVTLKIIRNGEEKHLDIVLRTQDGSTELVSNDRKKINDMLGASFESITEAQKENFEIRNGVVVKNLTEGVLKDAGVPEGFIITRIDNNAIYTPADIYRYFKDRSGGVLLEGINPDGSRGYYGFGLETQG